MKEIKECDVYCRSSVKQKENKKLLRVKEFCDMNNIKINKVYFDNGGKTNDTPAIVS